ncbi:MAG: hypothetical protein JSV38_15245 [Desulfobacterales bacterium]|nr:MAG: hypothetical protein JSV38_15245 [Desulfobacterales bacterium]
MFTYAIGVLFLLVIWLSMYIFVPKSRKAIFWSSIAWGHVGPIIEYWHLKDYWNPVYMLRFEVGKWVFGIEDYFFAFACGGLSAGIFDILIRKTGEEELAKFYIWGLIKLLIAGIGCLFVTGVLISLFHINSLHAIVVTFLFGATLLIVLQPKWTLPTMLAGIIGGLFMWVFYWGLLLRLFPNIIEKWWFRDALSGISFGGVPIEEVIWASSTALFVGPISRYCLIQRQLKQ